MFINYLNFTVSWWIDDVIVNVECLRSILSVIVTCIDSLIWLRYAGTDDMKFRRGIEFLVLEADSNTIHVMKDVNLFQVHIEIEERESINYN